MKEKLKIRDFYPGDMEKLLDYREETAGISFPGMRIDRGQSRRSMLLHIQRNPGTIKVAEINGKAAGYVMFQPRRGSLGAYGRINIIFVEEGLRHKGVGKLLLDSAEKWLRSHGIKRMEAVVTNSNLRSCNFFREHGYREKRTVFEKRM
jgi:ribosomal protein S18 acetylase RimI-like enzyme